VILCGRKECTGNEQMLTSQLIQNGDSVDGETYIQCTGLGSSGRGGHLPPPTISLGEKYDFKREGNCQILIPNIKKDVLNV
jgi:hypothetical protein